MDRASDQIEAERLAPEDSSKRVEPVSMVSPGGSADGAMKPGQPEAHGAATASRDPASGVTVLPVLLKVLAGRHADADIDLESGATLVGSDHHCEIVLRDDGIEAEHLLLRVSEDRFTVRVLGAPVLVDGQLASSGQVLNYRPGMTIEMGSATIGLAPVGFDWPAEFARRAHANASANVESGSEAATAETSGDVADTASSGLAGFLSRHRRKLVIGGVAASLLLLVAIVAGAGGFGPQLPTLAEREAVARDLLSRLSLTEVAVETTADGRISLVGYVPDQRALLRLRQRAAEQEISVRAYPASELTRFAVEWLGSQNLKAEVTYLGAGVLEVVGQDPAGRQLSAAAERLALEVPGVSSVRQRISPPIVAATPKAAPPDPEPYVLGGVNGVNPGHPVPYISSGQSYIFSGGVLKNGMTVMAIEPERVVVDDHGRRLASEIQVR